MSCISDTTLFRQISVINGLDSLGQYKQLLVFIWNFHIHIERRVL